MQTPETHVLILRLVFAGVLGGLIGAEREYRAKMAGMRTHVLVAIGAALMLIVSRWGFCGLFPEIPIVSEILKYLNPKNACCYHVWGYSMHPNFRHDFDGAV